MDKTIAKLKKSKYLIIILLLSICACSKYGITELKTSNGNKIYFKREARGLNYDSVILSANDNYCAEYNPELDYRFTTIDPTIYYKIDSNALYLLSGNLTLPGYEYKPEQYVTAPKSFPVKVVIVKPDKLIVWEKRKELYQDKGMELLEIPIDDNLKCYFK